MPAEVIPLNSYCTGNGEYFHTVCTCTAENAGTFIDSAAGGEDIVDQENFFIFDFLRLFKRK